MGTHLIWKISLEFLDTLQPVGCCFFTEQLDVQEGALPGAKDVPRSGSTDNTGRHIDGHVLEWN